MRIELDRVVRDGDIAFAALVKISVQFCGLLHLASVQCAKHPIAVLIRRDDVTAAFEIDGAHIELDDFEQRYPGKLAIFERLAIMKTQLPS
jgi:hypothetical protein